MTDLNGKTALITGSTSGIGRATAIALADRGAHILIVGRDDSARRTSSLRSKATAAARRTGSPR